jgi:glycosyltransferase involved in cell wall biosynthesis
MSILFIYPNMYAMGGIQTWLTRVAPRLRSAGHEVALLTRAPGEPWDSTAAFVDRLSLDVPIHHAGRHWFALPGSLKSRPVPADILFACNLPSLLMAVLVQQHLMPKARIVAGIFHPREYTWNTPRLQRRWVQHLAERILRGLPAPNFVLFSPATERYPVAEFLGRDLRSSPAVPIPIDTDLFRPPVARPVDRRKILSVARLTPSYAYIRQMIHVIRDLRNQGHEFTYHCYGDGDERAKLEAEALRLDVADAVFFPGSIPYDRFSDSVQDAFAFIGTGTALLEAAACRVPSLVAIDSHPGPSTYGFIHQTVGNSIGGHVEGQREYQITERLRWLANRTENQYRAVEQASRARAEEFALPQQLPRFVDALRDAAPYSPRISRFDRAIGHVDWLLEAVMLNLGARDTMTERFVRPTTCGEHA